MRPPVGDNGPGMHRVVRLDQTDLPAVADLEAACFAEPWSLRQIQTGFSQPSGCILGVRGDQTLVGYISLVILPPEMEILNIAVLPGCRAQGVGKALVQAALEQARVHQVHSCFLEVDESNAPALGLYEKFNFCPTGRRRGYYRLPTATRDAILMQRLLTGSEVSGSSHPTDGGDH